MPETNWVEKDARRIKLYDHEKTQSVNICTPANREGEYEEVFYFCERFRVFAAYLTAQDDLPTLRNYLRKRSYKQVVELWELSTR